MIVLAGIGKEGVEKFSKIQIKNTWKYEYFVFQFWNKRGFQLLQ